MIDEIWPVAVEKVPAGQNKHTLAPLFGPYVPVGQSEQVPAPLFENEPGLQGEQSFTLVRLELAPEANVPPGQACFLPPGQKNPAGQAVAAEETKVPASQEKPAGQAEQLGV